MRELNAKTVERKTYCGKAIKTGQQNVCIVDMTGQQERRCEALNLSEKQWRKLDTVSRFVLSFLIFVFCVVALGTFDQVQSFESDLRSSECYFHEGNFSSSPFLNYSRDYPLPKYSRKRFELNGVD